jgi:RNA polymerase sigma-70 factor, ECF subfamily
MSSSSVTAVEIVRRCLRTGNQEAWAEFVRFFQPLVTRSVLRVMRNYGASSPALVDDLAQETYMRICKQECRALQEFEHRHEESIFGYIKVIATSVAIDHFRSLATQKRRGEVADDGTNVQAVISPRTIEHTAILRELDDLLAAKESERDRNIFWLYYRQGFTARDIASMPHLGLTQKGVESCIYRLTQTLRNAVKSRALGNPSKGKPGQSTLGVIK